MGQAALDEGRPFAGVAARWDGGGGCGGGEACRGGKVSGDDVLGAVPFGDRMLGGDSRDAEVGVSCEADRNANDLRGCSESGGVRFVGEAGGGFESREPSAAGVVNKVVGTGAATGFTGLADRGEGLEDGLEDGALRKEFARNNPDALSVR